MALIRKKELPPEKRVTYSELMEVINSYNDFLGRIGNVTLKAGQTKRNLKHFVFAATLAKGAKLKAEQLIEIVAEKLSAINKKNVVPTPNQLYGERASVFVVEGQGGSGSLTNSQIVMNARAAAATRRFKPLDEDPVFLKSKSKLKQATHTLFDFTYLKERYIQQNGEAPDWLAKYERTEKWGKYV